MIYQNNARKRKPLGEVTRVMSSEACHFIMPSFAPMLTLGQRVTLSLAETQTVSFNMGNLTPKLWIVM